MQTRQLIDELEREIERIAALKAGLENEGPEKRILCASEKKQIRHILSGSWLDMINEECAMFFRQGNVDDCASNMEFINETLNKFS